MLNILCSVHCQRCHMQRGWGAPQVQRCAADQSVALAVLAGREACLFRPPPHCDGPAEEDAGAAGGGPQVSALMPCPSLNTALMSHKAQRSSESEV